MQMHRITEKGSKEVVRPEAYCRVRPVLGGSRHNSGSDPAKYICGSLVYYFVHTGWI